MNILHRRQALFCLLLTHRRTNLRQRRRAKCIVIAQQQRQTRQHHCSEPTVFERRLFPFQDLG